MTQQENIIPKILRRFNIHGNIKGLITHPTDFDNKDHIISILYRLQLKELLLLNIDDLDLDIIYNRRKSYADVPDYILWKKAIIYDRPDILDERFDHLDTMWFDNMFIFTEYLAPNFIHYLNMKGITMDDKESIDHFLDDVINPLPLIHGFPYGLYPFQYDLLHCLGIDFNTYVVDLSIFYGSRCWLYILPLNDISFINLIGGIDVYDALVIIEKKAIHEDVWKYLSNICYCFNYMIDQYRLKIIETLF